jgi:hypothetical protein
MADAVLAGDGLDAVAALTAEATGGTVAIVLPAVGAAVAGAGGDRRLAAVRRFVVARLAGQPGALPEGYVADAAVGADAEKVGAVVLPDDGRPPAAGAQAVLRLAAVAALTVAALDESMADGPRAAGALLEDLRRAPISAHEPAPGRLHAALREADVALALVRAGEASAADAASGAWQLLVRLASASASGSRRGWSSTPSPRRGRPDDLAGRIRRARRRRAARHPGSPSMSEVR